MHELSIAQEIYSQSRTAVSSHGPGRLERVQIAVGELTAIEPEILTFAWEAVVAGSPDEGCLLEIDWRKAKQYCQACQDEVPRAAGQWLPLCGRCHGPLHIEGGQELDLLQVTFERDESGEGSHD